MQALFLISALIVMHRIMESPRYYNFFWCLHLATELLMLHLDGSTLSTVMQKLMTRSAVSWISHSNMKEYKPRSRKFSQLFLSKRWMQKTL